MRRLLRLIRYLQNDQISQLSPFSSYHETETAIYLQKLMRVNYTVTNLKNVTTDQFQSYITSLPGEQDATIEGYVDSTYQRDLSVQFEWGHNHDFGTFYMPGRMKNRHIDILAAFMSVYGISEKDLRGKTVLDIGCWTGGTSLLLAAMGAYVFTIEEVCKYANSINYLKDAFGIDNLKVENRSLYSLNSEELFDRFDLALYFRILYHVTDPVLSLRIVFNSLKDGGICLLETMAVKEKGSYCEYRGARETLSKPTMGEPRSGWNWFVPSIEALFRMMTDVGFDVRKTTLHRANRALALGVRNRHVDMLRAGLSNPDIR